MLSTLINVSIYYAIFAVQICEKISSHLLLSLLPICLESCSNYYTYNDPITNIPYCYLRILARALYLMKSYRNQQKWMIK